MCCAWLGVVSVLGVCVAYLIRESSQHGEPACHTWFGSRKSPDSPCGVRGLGLVPSWRVHVAYVESAISVHSDVVLVHVACGPWS